MIEKIANKTPVAGIKQSGNDFPFLLSLIKWAKDNKFEVFAGNDILLTEAMQEGSYGGIGGLVNVIPEVFEQIMQANFYEDKEKLHQLSVSLKELGEIVRKLTFPLNIAAFMEARDLPIGHVKMPISPATMSLYQSLKKEYRSWLLKYGI